MKQLDFYLHLRNLDKTAFAEKHPHPFLLLEAKTPSEEKGQLFQTQKASLADFKEAFKNLEELAKSGAKLAKDTSNVFLSEIRKKEGNPFADKIFVGRTNNSDIHIEDGTISKSHAFFELDANNQSLFITDLGSTNGTKVNGKKLQPNQKQQVKVGDKLQIGHLDFSVIENHTAWQMIKDSVVSS